MVRGVSRGVFFGVGITILVAGACVCAKSSWPCASCSAAKDYTLRSCHCLCLQCVVTSATFAVLFSQCVSSSYTASEEYTKD